MNVTRSLIADDAGKNRRWPFLSLVRKAMAVGLVLCGCTALSAPVSAQVVYNAFEGYGAPPIVINVPTKEQIEAAEDAAAMRAGREAYLKKERAFIRNELSKYPRYGALALTADGRSAGVSKMAMNEVNADLLALNQCGVEGCRLVHRYKNACLSLAEVKQADGRIGYGWQTLAKGMAPTCNATSCKVVETACSVPGRDVPVTFGVPELGNVWGALAVNIAANKYKIVAHQPSMDEAKRVAANECDPDGYASNGQASCFAIVTFANSCLSMAKGTARNGVVNTPYSSTQPTRQQAQQDALATCKRQGAKQCKVVETSCSFRLSQ